MSCTSRWRVTCHTDLTEVARLQISLKSHLFAFGSMLRDYLVREQPTNQVMELAYYLFNWATVQSYKWKFNKGTPPDVRALIIVRMLLLLMVVVMVMIIRMMVGSDDDDDDLD